MGAAFPKNNQRRRASRIQRNSEASFSANVVSADQVDPGYTSKDGFDPMGNDRSENKNISMDLPEESNRQKHGDSADYELPYEGNGPLLKSISKSTPRESQMSPNHVQFSARVGMAESQKSKPKGNPFFDNIPEANSFVPDEEIKGTRQRQSQKENVLKSSLKKTKQKKRDSFLKNKSKNPQEVLMESFLLQSGFDFLNSSRIDNIAAQVNLSADMPQFPENQNEPFKLTAEEAEDMNAVFLEDAAQDVTPIDFSALRVSLKKSQQNSTKKQLPSAIQDQEKPISGANIGKSAQVDPKKQVQTKPEEKIDVPLPKDNEALQKEKEIYKPEMHWGEKGKVDFRSLGFKVRYKPGIKGFEVVETYNKYIVTRITWKPCAQLENCYEVTLNDQKVVNLSTGGSVPLKSPSLSFLIDYHGELIAFVNSAAIAQEIAKRQTILVNKKKKMPFPKVKSFYEGLKPKLKKSIEDQIRQHWDTFMGYWIREANTSEGEQKDIGEQEIEHAGETCLVLSKSKTVETNKITEFVQQSYFGNEKKREKLEKSEYFIRDLLEAWDFRDRELDQRLNPLSKRFPAYDNEVETAILNKEKEDFMNMRLAEKYSVTSTLTEKRTLRPHIINADSASKLIFESRKGTYASVQQDLRLFLFMWPDLEEMRREEFLLDQIAKFQDACNTMLKDLTIQVMGIPFVPLKYKPKTRKQKKNELNYEANETN